MVTPKPVKLMKYLKATRGFKISEVYPGIYNIDGESFPIQIILSKRLSAKENVFLRNLRSQLTQNDMADVFEAYKNYGSPDKRSVYLDRIFGANKSVFKEVFTMTATNFNEWVHEYAKKIGLEDELINRGMAQGMARGQDKIRRETALEMLRKGFKLEDVAAILKMPVAWVQDLLQESAKNNQSVT